MDKTTFFALVDEVLIKAGRNALRRGGHEQKIVEVRPGDRVLQILAGPGSGKTEMLVWRVLYELFVNQIPAHRLMVTTFTRKAATELSVRLVERSDDLLGFAHAEGLSVQDPHVHDVRVGTLHSLCDSLLAEFDEDHMQAGTQLIDEHESTVRLLRNMRWKLGWNSGAGPRRLVNRLVDTDELVSLFRAPWDGDRWPSSNLTRANFISALLAQHTETWIPRCGGNDRPNGVELVHSRTGLTDDLKTLHRRWVDYLDENSILDFAVLQHRFYERQDRILPELTHVFVDEFQDTNPIQYAIHMQWLESSDTRLTLVGDDDQSLYRFRGSDIACFTNVGPECNRGLIPYRVELLEENHRSTKRIVKFTEAFRQATVLETVSMPKTVRAPRRASTGEAVRLLEGAWPALCDAVAQEIEALGAARRPAPGAAPGPSVAILMFSTSERGAQPAHELRTALEAQGLRVYNPRNKTAADRGSPVHSLMGCLSYLIDPVDMAPAGVGGRSVMVWASMGNARSAYARSEPPGFPLQPGHADIQKQFIKAQGAIGSPGPEDKPLCDYLDQIRYLLADATMRADKGQARRPRLTISGLVARLLSFPKFRECGYTVDLFRQALFTSLLEANVAPTRLTSRSLDTPMEVRRVGSKYSWPDRFWELLSHFGVMLSNTRLDDDEVEAFSDHSVSLLTFHQAKGLEFDHVYVARTGREIDLTPVLRTMLFSGNNTRYSVENGQVATRSRAARQLADADKAREVYVALTRPLRSLTVLHAPGDDRLAMGLHPGLARVFASAPRHRNRFDSAILERRFT